MIDDGTLINNLGPVRSTYIVIVHTVTFRSLKTNYAKLPKDFN